MLERIVFNQPVLSKTVCLCVCAQCMGICANVCAHVYEGQRCHCVSSLPALHFNFRDKFSH